MKLIHLSDLHLGKRVNGFSMLEDQEYILREILAIITEEAPDAVLIAGDVYDKNIPPTEAVELLDEFLFRLSGLDLQVFLISGNHDSPERLAFASRLIAPAGIHLSPVYGGTVEPVVLSDEHGPVNIYLLPFVKPVHVRRFFPGEKIESYNDALGTAVKALGIDPAQRNILVTHQFVTGAVRSESEEISVGGTENVDASVFDGFDYVALGHIHGPQNIVSGHSCDSGDIRPGDICDSGDIRDSGDISPGDTHDTRDIGTGNTRDSGDIRPGDTRGPQNIGTAYLRYCGTPLKYSFSEANQKKSVTVVSLGEKGSLAVRTVPLRPLRDMREIRGSYEELTYRPNYEGTQLNDYLHITLTDEEDVPDAIGKLRLIYPNLMKLDYDNSRTRSAGTLSDLEDAERKSPLVLFEEFYEQQNGRPMSDEQAAFARGLMEEIWEEKL